MARRPRILIGTASWTDRSLLESKKWYPPEIRTPAERLAYYASRFSLVEVDSTYYSLEMEPQARTWAENTPNGFVFDIKAFRLFTGHQAPPSMLPRAVRDALGPLPEKKRNWYVKDVPRELQDELWSYFHASLRPLRDAKKLGAIIFQMPPWTMPKPEARDYLAEMADRLDGHEVAVEFRNEYWLSDRRRRETLAFLREHGFALVIVDEPQGFRWSAPQVWEVTDPALTVVRLHGRNGEMWEKKGLRMAAERFNYEYSRSELEDLAASVWSVASQATAAHVTFNNNFQDLAQRNAEEFAGILAHG